MGKNSLAKPRMDGFVPVTAASGSAALWGIGAATGRTDRIVRTIADCDSLNRSQPVKVLPLQSSNTVPGVIRKLSTVNGVILAVGPEIVMPGPAKRPFAYKVAVSCSCAAAGAETSAMSAAKTDFRIFVPPEVIGHRDCARPFRVGNRQCRDSTGAG
jgi:hypothetical protein